MIGVSAAMHMYMAWKSGSMKREPVDIAFKPTKEARHLKQVDQNKSEETVVHKEAQRILRVMKETMVPKKTQRSNQEQDKTEDVVTPSYSSQEQDKTEETMMSKEAHCLDQMERRQQEHDTEFQKQQQDQQHTTSENEVKRVTKLDTAGQEMLDKIFKDTVGRSIETMSRTEVGVEAKRKGFMLRQ